jgi:hypothetical protein
MDIKFIYLFKFHINIALNNVKLPNLINIRNRHNPIKELTVALLVKKLPTFYGRESSVIYEMPFLLTVPLFMRIFVKNILPRLGK